MNNIAKRKKRNGSEIIASVLTLLLFYIAYKVFILSQSFTIVIIVATVYITLIAIISIVIRELRNEKISKSGINEIDKMDGKEFELFLALLFKKYGYKTKVTKYQGDYGADLIIIKNRKSIAIQAKRYNSNVGIKAVQEIIGAKGYYKTNEAWVVTNSQYTQAAIQLARTNNVTLFDRKALIDLILKSKSSR